MDTIDELDFPKTKYKVGQLIVCKISFHEFVITKIKAIHFIYVREGVYNVYYEVDIRKSKEFELTDGNPDLSDRAIWLAEDDIFGLWEEK